MTTPRTHQIVVRLTESEADAARRIAEREGLTLSAVVRRGVLREIERHQASESGRLTRRTGR